MLSLALVIGASCQDHHGVEVIVQPGNPAVKSVRVFVGTGDSTNSSLTTSSKAQVDDVEYWSHDANNESDVVTNVDGTGEVKFLFSTSDAISAVIAVGYDANQAPIVAGAMTDLEVRDSGYTGYEVPLMGPIAPLGTAGATVQLGLWSPQLDTPAYTAACAGIVVAGDDHPYFVVTDNDQDCDGLTDDDTAHECTPDVYLGTRAADPSEAQCLVSDHTASGIADCKLGSATCTDNVPRTQNMCVAGHTCTLNEQCMQCMMSLDCAANAEMRLATIDHYECALPRKASDSSICQTTFALARPPTGGYGCKDLQIGNDTSPLGGSLTVGGVELDATLQDSSTSSCAGKLMAKLSSSPTAVDFTGLVSFDLKNNAGIALPIHVTMGTSTATACPDTTECTLVPAMPQTPVISTFEPGLTQCAAAWNAPAPIANLFAGNTGSFDPTLSSDQLEMIYASNDVLYRTTRTAIGGMWSTATPLDLGGFAIPSGATLRAPALSPGGVEMFFAVQLQTGTTTMYYATRSSTTAAGWNLPAPITYADAGFEVDSIAWGPGMHVIVGTVDGTAATALYDATWDLTTKTLSTFTLVNPKGSHPYLSADGMQLYFDQLAQLGGSALFVASRRSPTDAFAPEVELLELNNGDSTDSSPWVPAGAHAIYFASQRSGSTVPALFTAQRASF